MVELAIPLMALGSMYVLSKQKKSKVVGASTTTRSLEGFAGLNTPRTYDVNYPVLTQVTDANVKQYSFPNQTTDKFFDPVNYALVEQMGGDVGGGGGGGSFSMTGQPLDKDNFKHNNMQPFFGAKVRGGTIDRNIHESVLDNMSGSGSQHFSKEERAPMFKPQEHLQYANGAPNMSDFMQSRVNPSMRMANVKPWEEQRVAPGLGLGFTQCGSAGFNSGMEVRDKWLPRTVDELRVETNPKTTFELRGHEGPGNAFIKTSQNAMTQGKVEKYLPDKFFASGPERWFTTTGLEHAPTTRSNIILQDSNRLETTAEYYGASANDGSGKYTTSAYEPSKKIGLPTCATAPPSAVGQQQATTGDYGVQGYNVLNNNRTTCRTETNFGSITSLVKAVMSPVLDILRPSKKDETILCQRSSGNATAAVPKGQIYNPADRTKTTIKETTEGRLDCNHLNIEHQAANAYMVTDTQPTNQQRDTTTKSYHGTAGPSGAYSVSKSYEAEYRQHNNVNKTYGNRPNQGGMQLLNSNVNVQTDRRDADRDNNRWWAGTAQLTQSPSLQQYGQLQPMQSYDDQRLNAERINPDILSAFKSNPYTQSLNSWA